MASKELIKAWTNYEQYIEYKGVTDEVLKAMTDATRVGFIEGDIEYGMMMQAKTLEMIERIIREKTNGTFAMLENYAQENKTWYDYLEWHYDCLLSASRTDLDSFQLYVERDRKRKERFYEPTQSLTIPVYPTFFNNNIAVNIINRCETIKINSSSVKNFILSCLGKAPCKN